MFGKCVGWPEFEFAFNALETRDEQTEVNLQVQLLTAGVLTVDEVRALRGLAPLTEARQARDAAVETHPTGSERESESGAA